MTVVDNRTGRKYTVGVSARRHRRAKARCAIPKKPSPDTLRFARCACMQLEVSDGGTINAQALKQIKAGGDGVGLRSYDPGCAGGDVPVMPIPTHTTMLWLPRDMQ